MKEPLNIVTIVAKNYLAHARTLVDSFHKYNPAGEAFVLLADHVDSYFDPKQERFNLIEIEELRNEIPHLDAFCFQYSVIELSTALKPFLLKYLFRKFNIAKLAYFDPDILITDNLDYISKLLEKYNIVLIPHITTPFSDNRKPSELELLRAGTYNLGFIGMANKETSISMLNWWGKRLKKQCIIDFSQGLFVDQKWIDLVPGLFPGVYILREPGYNVAYWNLHERKITIEDQKIYCNGKPLYFFHFSGFSPERDKEISKHQNRYKFSQIGQASNLFQLYTKLLIQNGYYEVKDWPYAFSCFNNGVPISDIVRRIFLGIEEKQVASFGNPFDAYLPNSFFRWLTKVDKHGLSPLLREIYYMRADLRQAFPDIKGKDRYSFLLWCLNGAKSQYNLDDRLLEDVKLFLQKRRQLEKIKHCENPLPSMYNYRRWYKMRSLYHNFRKYSILRPFLDWLKPYVVNKFKYNHQIHPLEEGTNSRRENISIDSNLIFGVNISGYINSEKGMGEGVRSDIRCLQTTNIPFVLNNFIDSGSVNNEMDFNNLSEDNPYGINLIHINADQLPFFIQQRGKEYLKNRYNIGYWAWELSHFPEEWYGAFQYLDEIWVPSAFVQNAVSRASPLPVVTIPHSVLTPKVVPKFDRSYFGLPPDSFIFLFIFDFDSFMARKNPIGLVKSFKKAFTEKENVVLVIKCSHSNHYPDDFKALKEISENTNIKIIDAVFSRKEINSLLFLCDCYVSLHRSEGFGLTMAEAMCAGKPVIATAYSGNMDFMTPRNSYLVKYDLIEIDQDYGPYKKGWLWAEPDINHASQLMRHVYENREEAEYIGGIAAEHIQRYYNPKAIGQIYEQRLNRIKENKPYLYKLVSLSKEEARKQLNIENNLIMFLCPGSTPPHKGLDSTIQTFKEIKNKYMHLFIVGLSKKGYPEKLKNMIDGSNVKFLEKQLTEEEFDMWIVASDCIIIPYKEVPDSNIIKRIKLYNKPVIASNVAGIIEHLNGNDIVFQDNEELKLIFEEFSRELTFNPPSNSE